MAKKQSTGFAGRLRELRAAAGLSQAELAERAGLHLHGVTKLEQGDREPAWATVLTLARALGVSCEAFQDTTAGPPGDRAGGPSPAVKDVPPADRKPAQRKPKSRKKPRPRGG